ncbi:MAG: DUF6596 domain-containing protein [Myxococcota bacterium]
MDLETDSDPRRQIELAARSAYGRLLAWLVSRSGNIAAAEDALGDALLSALSSWPGAGVPRNPEAWLLSVARRRLIDQHRRQKTQDGAADELIYRAQLQLHKEAAEAVDVPFRTHLPDRRLELLFMCAHPDIPARMRTPLMLQTVLGLSAEAIAALMLLPPSTVSKRLVRLKKSIAGRLAFELPPQESFPRRLGYVLDAVYAAYGTGWDSAPDLGGASTGLAQEAFWLAGLLVRLMPTSAEAKGLYALLCFCESRRPARRSPDGAYVPLEEQDPDQWDQELIEEGEKALWLAAQVKDAGTYQTEAAIHSVHAHRAKSGKLDWPAIHFTYRVLTRLTPSVGAQIGYAASFGRIGDPGGGLGILDALDPKLVQQHQPFWAVRAWLLAELEQTEAARHAYARAIGLCEDAAVRTWLIARQQTLG